METFVLEDADMTLPFWWCIKIGNITCMAMTFKKLFVGQRRPSAQRLPKCQSNIPLTIAQSVISQSSQPGPQLCLWVAESYLVNCTLQRFITPLDALTQLLHPSLLTISQRDHRFLIWGKLLMHYSLLTFREVKGMSTNPGWGKYYACSSQKVNCLLSLRWRKQLWDLLQNSLCYKHRLFCSILKSYFMVKVSI